MEDDLLLDIKEIIENSKDGLLSSAFCIHKVPQAIRDLKEEAFTPNFVSIGPYHHGNVRLHGMERQKKVLFKRFTQIAKTSLDDLVRFAKESEPKVRASYSENIILTKKELAKLILIDAGFIIQQFMWICNYDHESDMLWGEAKTVDLILLQNQLPFFFLEELFNVAFPLHLRGDLPSFLELTCSFFKYYNPKKFKPGPNERIHHFTDLVRLFLLPSKKPPRISVDDRELLYSANELREAGIKLKRGSEYFSLELSLSGHVLEVSPINVDDLAETIFLNLIALEQCHYPHDSYITDYFVVLASLIRTTKDADILIHKGIVDKYIGDANHVALLFNGLRRNIIQRDLNCDYGDVCNMLNRFYKHPWRMKKAKWKISLKRDYCSTPWQTAASLAGILLLILTLVQTVFSILQVELKNEVEVKLV